MLITDPADPRLYDIRNLNKSDKSGEGLVIAEGPLVVSRLASGMPLGGDLEFVDELTLSRALTGRLTL